MGLLFERLGVFEIPESAFPAVGCNDVNPAAMLRDTELMRGQNLRSGYIVFQFIQLPQDDTHCVTTVVPIEI